MISRTELYQRQLRLEGEIQLIEHNKENPLLESLTEEVDQISSDLRRLNGVPESLDTIEEFYVRFLARCRLIDVGDYRIEGVIGAGWNGVVFRARNRATAGSPVAVKLLLLPRNHEELDRFEQEAELLLRLNHPCIVRGICAVQHVPDVPVRWFAMELVEGAQSFYSFAHRKTLGDVLKQLGAAGEGLAHAHKLGVIHRDLHFGNLILDGSGQPKVLDFGSARFHDHGHTFQPIGSFRTCAPEKFFQPDFVTGRSDVFSLAMMVYILVMGRSPFDSQHFGELIEKLRACDFPSMNRGSARLQAAVKGALAKNPDERPVASELAKELLAAATEPENQAIAASLSA